MPDSSRTRIALDVQGGDHALTELAEGALLSKREGLPVDLTLVGDGLSIQRAFAHSTERTEIQIIDAPDTIAMDSNLKSILKDLKGSSRFSMAEALILTKEGQTDVTISTGNTGIYSMLAHKFLGKMHPHLSAPAIVVPVPQQDGSTKIWLDIGCSVKNSPARFRELAILGASFAQAYLKKERLTLGIMNIGVESNKGNETTQAIQEDLDEVIRTHGTPIEKILFVEGGDIVSGAQTDVVLTDGFTGNIVLKAMESQFRLVRHLLEETFHTSLLHMLAGGIVKRSLKEKFARYNEIVNSGMPFIGLQQLAIKAHGNAKRTQILGAIRLAHHLHQAGIIEETRKEFVAIGHLLKRHKISEEKR